MSDEVKLILNNEITTHYHKYTNPYNNFDCTFDYLSISGRNILTNKTVNIANVEAVDSMIERSMMFIEEEHNEALNLVCMSVSIMVKHGLLSQNDLKFLLVPTDISINHGNLSDVAKTMVTNDTLNNNNCRFHITMLLKTMRKKKHVIDIEMINKMTNSYVNNDDNMNKCFVCYSMSDMRITKCGHIFCEKCLLNNCQMSDKCVYCDEAMV